MKPVSLLGFLILTSLTDGAPNIIHIGHHYSSSTAISKPHTASNDLSDMLQQLHNSIVFNNLSSGEKLLTVELLAAAEVDEITSLIDRIGFSQILFLIDDINAKNVTLAHTLEHYITQELKDEAEHSSSTSYSWSSSSSSSSTVSVYQRDLHDVLLRIESSPAGTSLSQKDKDLLHKLINAAETNTVTDLVHYVGYFTVMQLIEDLGDAADTHVLIQYLIKHLDAEAKSTTTHT